MHINPDHFLETENGRVWTAELNRRAWEQCHEALEAALARATPRTRLYLMVGPQGAGKSTWARARRAAEPEAVIFDAILVQRSERGPLIATARRFGVPAIAVWFTTPLEVCLARNVSRPADEVANERGLRNVFAALEPPSLDEGFEAVLEVHAD